MTTQKMLFVWDQKGRKDPSDLVIPFHYIDNFKKLFILSMMAVGQVCPHRLVVQDISLSRRQRGFDFPWG